MKIKFDLSALELMELKRLISEKKKSGIGNKRESVDLTGGNFGEGQPSCYRSIKQPSFGLFFAILVGWENQMRPHGVKKWL